MNNFKSWITVAILPAVLLYSTLAISQQAPRGTRQPLVPTKPGDIGGGVTTPRGVPLYPPGTRFDGVGNIPKPSSGGGGGGVSGAGSNGASGGTPGRYGGGFPQMFDDDPGNE
jgi:hypothetical protein